MEKGDNDNFVLKNAFEFNYVPDREFKILTNRELNNYLEKWYMESNLKLRCYSFNGKYNPNEKQQFASEFFKSSVFCCDPDYDARHFNSLLSIDIEEVPCTIQSLDFFDRLLEHENIIRKNGHIVQCYEEFYDGIQIPNELRKLLVDPDAENYNLFDKDERKEFIFRIFKHFVIGGEYCQYENVIYHYLGMTKALYSDIICVRKDKKNIKIKSDVFKVQCMSNEEPVYPSKKLHIQDFAYFAVDCIAKNLIVLSHKWA